MDGLMDSSGELSLLLRSTLLQSEQSQSFSSCLAAWSPVSLCPFLQLPQDTPVLGGQTTALGPEQSVLAAAGCGRLSPARAGAMLRWPPSHPW